MGEVTFPILRIGLQFCIDAIPAFAAGTLSLKPAEFIVCFVAASGNKKQGGEYTVTDVNASILAKRSMPKEILRLHGKIRVKRTCD